MTNISVGTTRTNLRIAEPVKKQPAPESKTEDIKLKGIVWSDKVNRQEATPKDRTDISVNNRGSVPAGNDLPDLFDESNNVSSQQQYQEEPASKPAAKEGGGEMATGIGMALGGVGGALIGNKLGFKKLGIVIGVAVGGFIGNKVGQ